ncbi:GNAT family N-acetyltransferase [Leifsonia poae]|uniref:N-acetyltransferase domain-containing protein n=1 Tax=Leifsonia poae TaxID=110933 RepID=A0A9W6HB83_9MICO|nr:GNAT family N-acetyltransferase [Leifsonia poae]GLJ77315.1 hypothetical protein GCM10017584_28890 [Leifsonia poae]
MAVRIGDTLPEGAQLVDGTADDVGACVAVWLSAVEARDGHPAVAGTTERCLAKFERPRVAFVVARTAGSELAGFGLVTAPGGGAATDPPGAAYLALLAVAPAAARHGIGGAILDALVAGSAAAGHDELVLHVLTDNTAAVGLYTSRGWRAYGDGHAHPLTGAASQTYVLSQR